MTDRDWISVTGYVVGIVIGASCLARLIHVYTWTFR